MMNSRHHSIASLVLISMALAICISDIATHYIIQPVYAAIDSSGSRNPRIASTVRPIPPKDTNASARSSLSRRLPFIPSRSRRAAKEAYLQHLQNELESAQRQLYVSQNTCTTLRKRCDDQRKETLELMGAGAGSGEGVGEEGQQQIQQQEEEIEQLQGRLQDETERYEQQVERLNLLSAELKELQVWKESQEHANDDKVLKYEQRLQESEQKQSDYAEQVELLALKLEAAQFAAKQRGEEGSESTSSWQQRAQVLRSELESVRAKYSKLIIKSIQEGGAVGDGGDDSQQVEEELDSAIQTAVESALESIETEWATKYEALEEQLNNVTEYVTSLEEERDEALGQLEEAKTSSMTLENEKMDPTLLQGQHEQLKEELRTELEETLTNELTEKLTAELTEALTEQIEKKYKKKYNRLRKELKQLKEQQAVAAENEQSVEEAAQERQQIIEIEMKKIKKQYEKEYEAKLQELQQQSEEQVAMQKERMRKLVRALLERETKQKGEGAIKTKKKSSSKKKKTQPTPESAGGVADEKDNIGEEPITISSLSSTRNKRARAGVMPVRGNR